MDSSLLIALIGSGAGIIGVIVGSLLSLIGQFLIFDFEERRWKKEKRIELLEKKRGMGVNLESYIPMSDDKIDQKIKEIIEEKNIFYFIKSFLNLFK